MQTTIGLVLYKLTHYDNKQGDYKCRSYCMKNRCEELITRTEAQMFFTTNNNGALNTHKPFQKKMYCSIYVFLICLKIKHSGSLYFILNMCKKCIL